MVLIDDMTEELAHQLHSGGIVVQFELGQDVACLMQRHGEAEVLAHEQSKPETLL